MQFFVSRFMTLILMGFVLISLSPLSQKAIAQQGGGDGRSQINLYYAKALPNGIDFVDDIFAMWGGRYAWSLTADQNVLAEIGGVYASDDNVDWWGGSASLRMDVPIETLVGIAFVGLDFTQYQGEGGEEETQGGLHAGGGVLARIGGNAHFRVDMKLNSKPGTSLVFGLGFAFDL